MNKRQVKKLYKYHGIEKRRNGWYKELKHSRKLIKRMYHIINPNINIHTVVKKRDRAGTVWYKEYVKNKNVAGYKTL